MPYNKLIEKGVPISIVELGCGVPFTARLLEHDGASKTLYRSYIPYSKDLQKIHGIEKAVSLDTLMRFVEPGVQYNIGHTGTIKSNYVHGYVNVNRDWIHYSRKIKSRIDGINVAREAIEYAVNLFIFGQDEAFHTIDMAGGATLKFLMNHANLLAFDKGKWVRPEELLRENKKIFRGSFNPPHNHHVEIGKDCIWEIGLHNYSKGVISIEDINHRIEMVQLLNRPVLISCAAPKFSDFVMLLPQDRYEFVVGQDVFDRIDPNDEVLKNHDFRVMPRDGISSTQIRAGQSNDCPAVIQKYIKENKLY